MIKNNSIREEIKKYLVEASLSDNDNIKEDTLIFEMGLLDSMGLLFLVEFIHENYSIEINDEELNPENFASINSITSFIDEKLKVV